MSSSRFKVELPSGQKLRRWVARIAEERPDLVYQVLPVLFSSTKLRDHLSRAAISKETRHYLLTSEAGRQLLMLSRRGQEIVMEDLLTAEKKRLRRDTADHESGEQ